MGGDILSFDPVPALLARLRPGKPARVSRAPGRLDVMGGIADYTGSLVCEMPLDRAAAVAVRRRDDRHVHVTSLNLLDEGRPAASVSVPLGILRWNSLAALRRELSDAAKRWAAYVLGCLPILDRHGSQLPSCVSSEVAS